MSFTPSLHLPSSLSPCSSCGGPKVIHVAASPVFLTPKPETISLETELWGCFRSGCWGRVGFWVEGLEGFGLRGWCSGSRDLD